MSKQASLLRWAVFCVFAGVTFLLYSGASTAGGRGYLLMPLDDVYIHFQYAKQLALGYPYQYNVGDVATSGATSFLYPYVLAFGYRIGFEGLSLGLWAMGVGAIALAASFEALFRTVVLLTGRSVLAWGAVLYLWWADPFAWHFMSGMETALMMALLLWTVWAVSAQKRVVFILSGSLLAMTRPEGSVIAGLASMAMAWQLRHIVSYRQLVILFLPILASGAQPLVNVLITGSWVATGNQSKSILATVGVPTLVLIERMVQNWLEIQWRTVGVGVFLGVGILFTSPRWRVLAVWIMAASLSVSGAISTLDNAFWHFGRYLAPLGILTLIMMCVLFDFFLKFFSQRAQRLIYGVVGVILCVVLINMGQNGLINTVYNAHLVYLQPFSMANWLRENTPKTAVVAVHDVGLMRYWGERNTLDLVGLTTVGASRYWRAGVGSVGELLAKERPDFIASYGVGHGYGLAQLEETPFMRSPLAVFDVGTLDSSRNVALAGTRQIITAIDPDNSLYNEDITTLPTGIQALIARMKGGQVVGVLNVADLASEQAFNYQWLGFGTHSEASLPYASEIRTTTNADNDAFAVTDGGRRVRIGEAFNLLGLTAGHDVLIIGRVMSYSGGSVAVSLNGQLLTTRILSAQAGRWQYWGVLIPREKITDSSQVSFMPTVDYLSARYWMVSGDFQQSEASSSDWIAGFDGGRFGLETYSSLSSEDRLTVNLTWQTAYEGGGDDRFFVHLYDNVDSPPIAQADNIPIGGSLPSGNWLVGTFNDIIELSLENVPEGTYTLAIGFYLPETGARLPIFSENLSVRDNRLMLQEVVVEHGR